MTAVVARIASGSSAGPPTRPGRWSGVGRCVSLTVRGRTCWRPVPGRGQRCTRCWSQLAASTVTSQRVELAAEPDLPGWVAAALVDDPEPMVRIVIGGRPDVAPELLHRLGADWDPGVRAALAANGSLPPDLDSRLAVDPDSDVLIRLAARVGVTSTVLSALRHHPDPRVRGAVAGNTSAEASLDQALACQEEDPTVLAALAAKATTPNLVLSWLAQHPAPLVAAPAARQLHHRLSPGP